MQRNTISMIIYFENKIKNMNSISKKNSFSSETSYENYLKNLKNELLKQHNKLIEICKSIEELKN